MNTITAQNVRKSKLAHIDKDILSVINHRVWLAGGCLRGVIDSSESVNDYDLFFRYQQDAIDTVAKLQQLGWHILWECPRGELTTMVYNPNKEKTLTQAVSEGEVFCQKPRVQLITKRYYQDMAELISTFDYTICMAAYDGTALVCTREFIKDVKRKRLRVNDITYPVATLNRMYKYRNYGFHPYEVDLVDIVHRINTQMFDPNNMSLYID